MKKQTKKLVLPPPNHSMGYTEKEILAFCESEDEFNQLMLWFNGQTVTRNDEGEFIYYTEDVLRGLNSIRYHIPTYFD